MQSGALTLPNAGALLLTDYRRLHGRPNVANDMDYLPEEIALVENLKNNEYLASTINSLEALPAEFAKLDIDKIENPFEKEDDLMVSLKIVHALEKFEPLRIIKKMA
ncbi:MAG TPA: hypothetical protein VFQ86_08285 [Arachidicoccus soli]|nr:hypothetical protein [Arachidicoccus soli]